MNLSGTSDTASEPSSGVRLLVCRYAPPQRQEWLSCTDLLRWFARIANSIRTRIRGVGDIIYRQDTSNRVIRLWVPNRHTPTIVALVKCKERHQRYNIVASEASGGALQKCAYAGRPTPYGRTCNVLPIGVHAGFVEAGSHYVDEVEYGFSMAYGPAEDAAAAVDAKSIVVQG